MVPTTSLTVKKQLDDKWAAAFYECGIPLEVASSQALCEAGEDTARLVRMPDHRCALVLTGFGAGKVGARRLHEPKHRLGGDLLDDADSSEQVSLKGALHLLAKLARPARSYLMGAGAVPSGRCGIASCTRR